MSVCSPHRFARPRRALLATVVAIAGLAGMPARARAAAPTVLLEADAFVAEARPDQNSGASTRLETDRPGVESHLRFRVEGVTTAVLGARLRLYVTNGSPDGPSVHATEAPWSEGTITWRNRPAPVSSLDDVARTTVGAWSEWNVTALVQGDGVYSFALLPGSTDGSDFASKEAGANRPQLVLDLGRRTATADYELQDVDAGPLTASWQPPPDRRRTILPRLRATASRCSGSSPHWPVPAAAASPVTAARRPRRGCGRPGRWPPGPTAASTSSTPTTTGSGRSTRREGSRPWPGRGRPATAVTAGLL